MIKQSVLLGLAIALIVAPANAAFVFANGTDGGVPLSASATFTQYDSGGVHHLAIAVDNNASSFGTVGHAATANDLLTAMFFNISQNGSPLVLNLAGATANLGNGNYGSIASSDVKAFSNPTTLVNCTQYNGIAGAQPCNGTGSPNGLGGEYAYVNGGPSAFGEPPANAANGSQNLITSIQFGKPAQVPPDPLYVDPNTRRFSVAPGADLQPPPDVDGFQYGVMPLLAPALYNGAVQGNGVGQDPRGVVTTNGVLGAPGRTSLVRGSVLYDFTLTSGAAISISDVHFKYGTSGADLNAVPEPTQVLVLLLGGLATLFAWRRKRTA